MSSEELTLSPTTTNTVRSVSSSSRASPSLATHCAR